ncbi:MAG TPA: sugar phosphate nucleotidyltransferase [Patescibacteria group bacterium]|nr:sugar phosphate nucleotidyltransferase [Patescibacteria group bacterium]
MKVLILCGGKGMRMKEFTAERPKPMALVDKKPLLWHIMKLFSYYGFNDFVLLLGYKSEVIKEYFMNNAWKDRSFVMDTTSGRQEIQMLEDSERWKITFLETGEDTMTGGRIKQAEPFVNHDGCFLTYGDGLAYIDIKELLKFHKSKGKLATITGIQKESQFGFINVENDIAVSFTEKPKLEGIINGGFFVLEKDAFRHIDKSNSCIFEKEPLQSLASAKQLAVYRYDGYWAAADTMKDLDVMNADIAEHNPFWYERGK